MNNPRPPKIDKIEREALTNFELLPVSEEVKFQCKLIFEIAISEMKIEMETLKDECEYGRQSLASVNGRFNTKLVKVQNEINKLDQFSNIGILAFSEAIKWFQTSVTKFDQEFANYENSNDRQPLLKALDRVHIDVARLLSTTREQVYMKLESCQQKEEELTNSENFLDYLENAIHVINSKITLRGQTEFEMNCQEISRSLYEVGNKADDLLAFLSNSQQNQKEKVEEELTFNVYDENLKTIRGVRHCSEIDQQAIAWITKFIDENENNRYLDVSEAAQIAIKVNELWRNGYYEEVHASREIMKNSFNGLKSLMKEMENKQQREPRNFFARKTEAVAKQRAERAENMEVESEEDSEKRALFAAHFWRDFYSQHETTCVPELQNEESDELTKFSVFKCPLPRKMFPSPVRKEIFIGAVRWTLEIQREDGLVVAFSCHGSQEDPSWICIVNIETNASDVSGNKFFRMGTILCFNSSHKKYRITSHEHSRDPMIEVKIKMTVVPHAGIPSEHHSFENPYIKRTFSSITHKLGNMSKMRNGHKEESNTFELGEAVGVTGKLSFESTTECSTHKFFSIKLHLDCSTFCDLKIEFFVVNPSTDRPYLLETAAQRFEAPDDEHEIFRISWRSLERTLSGYLVEDALKFQFDITMYNF